MRTLVSAIFTFYFLFSILSISAQCEFSDDCLDVTDALMPETNEDFSFNFLCINDCLDGATAETELPAGIDCKFSEYPSIWYKIELDDSAEQIFIASDAIGWQPVWALYSGDNCDNLVQLDQSNNMSPACSNLDNTPDLSQDGLLNGSGAYYLLLTIDRPIDQLFNTEFELCVSTTSTPTICIGEIDDNCFVSDTTYQVVSREFPGSLEGPFLPGEEITICVDYFYDSTNTGAEWMNSLIPSFGVNWDKSFFDPSSLLIDQGQWLETDGDCGAILQENISTICTYTNADGELTLCNSLCQSCPCETGMQEGDPLPSGWFWVTVGGGAGCGNDCSPGEGWGSGSTTFQFNFCMDLKIKDQPDYSINNGLQISMNVISDGVTGCWEDPTGECLIFKPFISPVWKIDTCEETALDNLSVTELETCEIDESICYGKLLTFIPDNFPDGTEFLWTLKNEADDEFFSQDTPTLSFNIYEEGQIYLSLAAKYNCQIMRYDTSFMVEPIIQLDSLELVECSGFVIDVNPQEYVGYEGDIDPFDVITSETDTIYEITFFTEDSCGCRFSQYLEIQLFVAEEAYDTVSVTSEPFELIYLDTVLTTLGEHIILIEGASENGCDSIYYVTVELSSAISELGTYHSIIYPNPTTDFLHLQLSDIRLKSIQVFDVSGNSYELDFVNNQLDVSGLSSGVYFLRLEYAKGASEFHKFIKI